MRDRVCPLDGGSVRREPALSGDFVVCNTCAEILRPDELVEPLNHLCSNSDHDGAQVEADREITVRRGLFAPDPAFRCAYCAEGFVARQLRAGFTVTIRPIGPAAPASDEDDLAFARETLGPDATDDEVHNLADLRLDRDEKER